MSETQCDFVAGCPIFRYFKRVAKQVYMNMYCLGNFERCRRY